MDVLKMPPAKQLQLCRLYFYMGFMLLPLAWFINAVWFFKVAFISPYFVEQDQIKKYVKLSALFTAIWVVIFLAWQIFFHLWRPVYPEVADYLSFVFPLGRV
uniref:Gamma-secretase subunit PEN-2 n=1 Tax=Steinernema glaseri TaxID=37863 RepID=A0A1I7ZAL8_9BILA